MLPVEDMVADNRVDKVDFEHFVHHSIEVDDKEDNDSIEEGNMVDNQLEVDMSEVVVLQPDHVQVLAFTHNLAHFVVVESVAPYQETD